MMPAPKQMPGTNLWRVRQLAATAFVPISSQLALDLDELEATP